MTAKQVGVVSRGDDVNSTNEKPKCKLIGTNGNVFMIVGAVSLALKNAGQREKASEFVAKAMAYGSYDAVLALCFEYVDVQ